MSYAHRRMSVLNRQKVEIPAAGEIPAWKVLQKMPIEQVNTLAESLGIDSSAGRMKTISAINKAR